MCDSGKSLCIGISVALGCVGVLLLVILLPLSLQRVQFDEVAIVYDTVSREMGDEILTEGLHDVGPSGELLIFKTTQRHVALQNMITLTSDSIEVELEVDVLWSVIPSDVRQILDKFGDQDGHLEYVRLVSETVIRDVAATFSAKDFFVRRQDFQTRIQAELQTRFQESAVHATVDSAQVSNIELPPSVKNALEASTIAEQDIQNALSERSTAIQAANIKLELARSEAELTIIGAEKDVRVIQETTKQQVLAERAKMQQRATAFSNISAGLNKGGDFFVNAYLKHLVARNNEGTTVVGI